jgi:hypothetical protein
LHTRVVLQFVNSPNLLLDWEIVRYEVPQGSVLSPLLFNVYINNFPCIINKISHVILFADDTNIRVSSSDLNEQNSKLNSVLSCISKWFQNKQLVLNLNKMHAVNFTSSQFLTYPLNILYHNPALTVPANIKFFGMHLDRNVTWKSHIDNLIKKLNSICFILRKFLHILKLKVLRMAYFAHFYSHISYGIVFWSSSSSMKMFS